MIAGAVRAVHRRLRDTRGFMIGEQLISIIFIGLLCVAVAAGLQAAMSSYASITRQTQADMMLSNAVELISDELAYAQANEAEGTPSVTSSGDRANYLSATLHVPVELVSDSSGILMRLEDGSSMPLVAASGGMRPTVSFALSSDKKTWTLSILIIPENAQGTTTLAEVQNLTVKRIGS